MCWYGNGEVIGQKLRILAIYADTAHAGSVHAGAKSRHTEHYGASQRAAIDMVKDGESI